MTRIMGDSTTLDLIPLTVNIAASYANGAYAVTSDDISARFPPDKYGNVLIDVTGSAPAVQVRDWETGNKGGSLEQWIIDHNKATGKKDAVVYCNRSTIPEVRQLTGSQVLGRDYWLWVATLDGSLLTPDDYPGVVACQDKGPSLTGGHWDSSIVWDSSLWLPSPGPPAAGNITRIEARQALATLTAYISQA